MNIERLVILLEQDSRMLSWQICLIALISNKENKWTRKSLRGFEA